MKPNRYEGWTREQLKEEDKRIMRELQEAFEEMEAYAKSKGWKVENTWLEDAIETAQREKLTDPAELDLASQKEMDPVLGLMEQFMAKLNSMRSCADLETLEKEYTAAGTLKAELFERCWNAWEKILASRIRALGVEIPTE
uniref:Uncharacterized protein n=1 Tax=uncultured prokaryote TaxID=198431 RepID=A0A0H5PVS5_9ZZZZ|nr:unnamed protein product [uncultured bacterium]CRY93698.1 hypothetical protein [uncultured prokaryote]